MLKPESFLENETYRILWDFEIQMDPQSQPKYLMLINKKITCHLVNFEVPAQKWKKAQT